MAATCLIGYRHIIRNLSNIIRGSIVASADVCGIEEAGLRIRLHGIVGYPTELLNDLHGRDRSIRVRRIETRRCERKLQDKRKVLILVII